MVRLFSQRFSELVPNTRYFRAIAGATGVVANRLRFDRKLPTCLTVRRRKFAMGRVGIGFIFELDAETGANEPTNNIRFVERTAERWLLTQPLYQQLLRLYVMSTKEKIIS